MQQLGSILCAALLLCAATSEATNKICDMVIEPVWAEAESLIDKLQKDAFATAFDVYIRDLKKNRRDFDEWRMLSERWAAENCRPLEARLSQHEAEMEAYNRACPSTVPDQATADRCNANAARLTAQAANLNAAISRVTAAWEKRNDDFWPILRAQERAAERARQVLDPANSENAFRLFALAVAKDVAAGRLTSCEALAHMSDALGPRSGWQYGRHLAIMGSVLATEGNPLVIDPHARSVRFTASGFRRCFVGPPGRGLENDNQVRHTVAYLMAGAEFGVGGATFASYMQDRVRHLIRGRVPEEHDYFLAIAAGEIGRDLKLHNLSVNDLGNTLRAKLCGY